MFGLSTRPLSLTLYLFQKPHTEWQGPEDITVPAGSRTVAVDSLEKSVNCVLLRRGREQAGLTEESPHE